MKIAVLSGSPKGEHSITLQSIKMVEKLNSKVDFTYFNLMSLVNKDDQKLTEIMDEVASHDAALWVFPLYHLSVPGHMKKFIERITALNLHTKLSGKYASTFTTSINYFDNLAHDYMEGICIDFGMNYISGLSHHMYALMNEDKRNEMCFFIEEFVTHVKEKVATYSRFKPLTDFDYNYKSHVTNKKYQTDKRITIVTDTYEASNVSEMITKFASLVDTPLKVKYLQDIKKLNYCRGCCNCGPANECVYGDKDGYKAFLDDVLETSDIIIFAGVFKDRYFSAEFKTFFDRTFVYTHTPVYSGKQLGFFVSGELSKLNHMYDIMYAYSSWESNLIGIVSDEVRDDNQIDSLIEGFCSKAIRYAEANYMKAATFQAIGAKKIFIDAVRYKLPLFVKDYNYYKRNGYFKKASLKEKIHAFSFRTMISIDKVAQVVKPRIIKEMYADHKKIVESM